MCDVVTIECTAGKRTQSARLRAIIEHEGLKGGVIAVGCQRQALIRIQRVVAAKSELIAEVTTKIWVNLLVQQLKNNYPMYKMCQIYITSPSLPVRFPYK